MPQVQLSKKTINDSILAYEIGWDTKSGFAYYNKFLQSPTVPDPTNTDSGVTLAVGIDCGYNTPQQIRTLFSGFIPASDVELLVKCSGLKKQAAVNMLPSVKHIKLPIDSALLIFYNHTISIFSKLAYSIYPAMVNINPVEQTCIVSLVFNRGTKLDGDRRKEMKALVDAIKRDNDKEMGGLFRSMKRLWANTKGLQIRYERLAKIIETPDFTVPQEDLLVVNF